MAELSGCSVADFAIVCDARYMEGEKLTGCQDGYSDSVSIVYIGYIHLVQLIQMNGCSVLPPHRDLNHFLLIFKKFF